MCEKLRELNISELSNKIKKIKLIIEKNNYKIYIPTLLLDQDDVLADLVLYLLKEYNEKYKTNYVLEDITTWSIADILGKEINEIMYNPETFLHLEPTKDAVKCLELLVNSGLFNIQIVSAAHPSVWYNKYLWVKKYLPFFNTLNMNASCNKNLFKGDVLFDDAPHNILKFKNGEAVIFDMPYNRNVEELKNFKRVSGWLSFTEYVLDKFYNLDKLEDLNLNKNIKK